MGEIADAMIEAEMFGMDLEDYLLEQDSSPPSPDLIADEARMLLAWINQWGDEENPPTTWELLEALFPNMDNGQSQAIVAGLEILASFHKEDL